MVRFKFFALLLPTSVGWATVVQAETESRAGKVATLELKSNGVCKRVKPDKLTVGQWFRSVPSMAHVLIVWKNHHGTPWRQWSKPHRFLTGRYNLSR